MSKDENGIPIGQLLNKIENSSKNNGTLIKMPISDSDSISFGKEIKKQLCYMNNVYYENIVPNKHYPGVNSFNERKIIRGNGWKFIDGSNPINAFHICLENITYSIAWSELGIMGINVPIALDFTIGELSPTPSRESIVYNKHSIKVIKDRIQEVIKYFFDKYNSENEATDDLSEYYTKNISSQVKFYNITDTASINMKDLLYGQTLYRYYDLHNIEYIPFKNLKLSNKDISLSHMIIGYNINRVIRSSSATCVNMHFGPVTKNILSANIWKLRYIKIDNGDVVTKKKSAFILETLTDQKEDIYIIKKSNRRLDEYIKVLSLKNKPKSEWRHIITEYQKIIDNHISKISLGNYSQIHINPNWEKSYKAGKSVYSPTKNIRNRKQNNEIFASKLKEYNSWSNEDLKIDYLEKFPGIIIYGTKEDKKRIVETFKLFKGSKSFNYHRTTKSLLCISVSKTNSKLLAQMKNTYTVNEALNSKFKTISRVATALKLKQIVESNSFEILNDFGEINSAIRSSYAKIINYIEDNINDINHYNKLHINFQKEIIKIAEDNKLINNDMLKETDTLKEYLKGIEILSLIDNVYFEHDESRSIIVNFLKKSKKRVNNEYYLKDTHQLLAGIINKRENENN